MCQVLGHEVWRTLVKHVLHRPTNGTAKMLILAAHLFNRLWAKVSGHEPIIAQRLVRFFHRCDDGPKESTIGGRHKP